MSWGVGTRNGLGAGLGNLISFVSGVVRNYVTGYLKTESDDNILQEDGSFIELE